MSFPIVCINLDRRPDRWKHFSTQPGLPPSSLQRFQAVDGTTLSIAKDPRISLETRLRIQAKKRRAHGEINTPGAIGCSLSHYNVWTSKLTDSPFTLICEDDTILTPFFLKLVETFLPTIPESADLWILSWRTYTAQKQGTPLTGLWETPPAFWGTNCYLLRKTAVPKLTAEFFPIESHLDRYFQNLHSLGKLQLVTHKNVCTKILGSGTDIQLYPCSLCNLPEDLNDEDLMITNKYMMYGLFAYAFMITLFLGLSRKNGSS